MAQHARASRVNISAHEVAGRFTLAVEDNGVGFQLSESVERGATGLLGMQERVESVGGRLVVESTPGAGARVYGRRLISVENQAPHGAIRVLIVDDHGLVRTGLRLMLEEEPDMLVLGEAADGDEALRLASELEPDVMLLDVSMPPPDGIEVARRLRDARSAVRVLMLTMHEDPELVRASFAAGAAGYMVKRSVTDELVEAIRLVAGGGRYVHPSVTGPVAG